LTAGVSADKQGQCINDLYGICRLPTDSSQSWLYHRFDRPQIGRLTDKPGPFTEFRKEMLAMRTKIIVDLFIPTQTEVFAAEFNGNDLFIRQGWWKTTSPDRMLGNKSLKMFTHQTVHHDDKMVSRHRVAFSFVNRLVGTPILQGVIRD
jgi:hypothetical protein